MSKNKTEEEVVNELGAQLLNYDGVEVGGGVIEESATTEDVEKKEPESVAEEKPPADKSDKSDKSKEPEEGGKENIDPQENAEPAQTNGKAEQKEEKEEAEVSQVKEGEEVFEVEAILDHKKHKNGTKYYIKWKGYALEDSTWENEDDVYAEELLEEYWAKQAQQSADSSKSSHPKRKTGRKRAAQSPPPTSSKRETKKQRTQTKSKSTSTKSKADHNEEEGSSQRGLSTPTASSSESWEDKVIAVETVTRDDKTGDLLVYLKWNNGETSRHPAKDVNAKCPQKMIKFYEQRLTFAPPSTHKS